MWEGAAYRILRDDDGDIHEIPVRLVVASVRAFPRNHLFQALEDGREVWIVERDREHFFLHDHPVSVRFA
ncbi:hypothetical protein EBT25_12415 [bacterium]|nr:hypothetical protein [bacterium]